VSKPTDCLEFILLADQDAPIHLWMRVNGDWAREIEYDKSQSLKIAAAILLFLFFGFILAASTLVLLVLLIGMVVMPAYLVGLIGYYREL
jgi:Flp pilus assembly protein TadB